MSIMCLFQYLLVSETGDFSQYYKCIQFSCYLVSFVVCTESVCVQLYELYGRYHVSLDYICEYASVGPFHKVDDLKKMLLRLC